MPEADITGLMQATAVSCFGGAAQNAQLGAQAGRACCVCVCVCAVAAADALQNGSFAVGVTLPGGAVTQVVPMRSDERKRRSEGSLR